MYTSQGKIRFGASCAFFRSLPASTAAALVVLVEVVREGWAGVMDLRTLLRGVALELGARLNQAGVSSGRETELILVPPWEITIQVSSVDTWGAVGPMGKRNALEAVIAALHEDNGDGANGRRLTPTEEAILMVCTRDRPMKAEAIARKVGRECNSYFRSLLTRLIGLGRLKRHQDGGGYVRSAILASPQET